MGGPMETFEDDGWIGRTYPDGRIEFGSSRSNLPPGEPTPFGTPFRPTAWIRLDRGRWRFVYLTPSVAESLEFTRDASTAAEVIEILCDTPAPSPAPESPR